MNEDGSANYGAIVTHKSRQDVITQHKARAAAFQRARLDTPLAPPTQRRCRRHRPALTAARRALRAVPRPAAEGAGAGGLARASGRRGSRGHQEEDARGVRYDRRGQDDQRNADPHRRECARCLGRVAARACARVSAATRAQRSTRVSVPLLDRRAETRNEGPVHSLHARADGERACRTHRCTCLDDARQLSTLSGFCVRCARLSHRLLCLFAQNPNHASGSSQRIIHM